MSVIIDMETSQAKSTIESTTIPSAQDVFMLGFKIVYFNADNNNYLTHRLTKFGIVDIFTNSYDCETYFRSIKGYFVIFIISGSIFDIGLTLLKQEKPLYFLHTFPSRKLLRKKHLKCHQRIIPCCSLESLHTHLFQLPKEQVIVILEASKKRFDFTFDEKQLHRSFVTIGNCMNFVASQEDTLITLVIVRDQFGPFEKLLKDDPYELLHPSITTIYLYDIATYSTYCSINSIALSIDEDNLVENLSSDLIGFTQWIESEPFVASQHQRSLRLAKNVRFHLLVDCLARLPVTAEARQELLDYSRQYYVNSSEEQRRIDEYERTYGTTNAINWYTRDAFLYKRLNEACRFELIETIYMFRSFISDLYKEIQQMPRITESTTVYRGQLMTKEELDECMSNVGCEFYTNGFISTSRDISYALVYAGFGQNRPELESVLFEFNIPATVPSKPCADISLLSNFPMEGEVLLSMGTLFRIVSAQFNSFYSVWHIYATLSPIQEYDYKYFEEELNRKHLLIALGNWLSHIEEYRWAEYFYLRYLDENFGSNDIYCKIDAHLGLVKVAVEHSEYAAAFDNLDIVLRLIDHKDKSLHRRILSLSADTYSQAQLWSQALRVFNQLSDTYGLTLEQRNKMKYVSDMSRGKYQSSIDAAIFMIEDGIPSEFSLRLAKQAKDAHFRYLLANLCSFLLLLLVIGIVIVGIFGIPFLGDDNYRVNDCFAIAILPYAINPIASIIIAMMNMFRIRLSISHHKVVPRPLKVLVNVLLALQITCGTFFPRWLTSKAPPPLWKKIAIRIPILVTFITFRRVHLLTIYYYYSLLTDSPPPAWSSWRWLIIFDHFLHSFTREYVRHDEHLNFVERRMAHFFLKERTLDTLMNPKEKCS